jgi:rhomboid protease GluP
VTDARTERVWERAEKRLDHYLRHPSRGTQALCALLTATYAWTCALDGMRGQPLWKVLGWNRSPALMEALGARTADLAAAGEWDRLLTYGVLHWNVGHLLMNVAAVWAVGEVLEAVYGPARVWLLFFVAVLTGGVASWLGGSPITVGASGGAFGLLGAMVAFGWRWGGKLHPHTRRWFGPLLWPWVLGNLGLGVVLPFIDNAAHVGGLLGGLALGATFGNRVTDHSESIDLVRQVTRVAAAVLTLLALPRLLR